MIDPDDLAEFSRRIKAVIRKKYKMQTVLSYVYECNYLGQSGYFDYLCIVSR